MDLKNFDGLTVDDFSPAIATENEPALASDYDYRRLIDALWHLPDEFYLDRKKWTDVGFALHNTDPALLHEFKKWSEQAKGTPHWEEGGCDRFWKSIKPRPGREPITAATIYRYAEQAGWRCYDFSAWTQPARVKPPDSEPFYKGRDVVDFVKLPREVNYIVDKLLVEGEPGVIGGPLKACKTVVAADAAVSISHGVPFLNKFETQKRVVSFFSGESGTATLGERIEAIAESKRLTLERNRLHIYERPMPRFDQPTHIDALREEIVKTGTQVLIIDPAYLCVNGESAGNLFKMGEQYGRIGAMCSDLEVTLLLLHHVNRAAGKDYSPLILSDLLWSGIAEWVRQWWLISRRSAYIDGVGDSELYLRAGGSAGHSSLYHLDISEGVQPNRFWRVSSVKDQSEVRTDNLDCQYAEDSERILAAMETGAPEFKTNIDKSISPRLNAKRFTYAFTRLLNDGEIVPVTEGKRTKYKLKGQHD